jgi:hypothetical protein
VKPRLRNRLLLGTAGGLTLLIAGFLYWDEHQAAPPSGPPPGAVQMHAPVIERRPGIRQLVIVPASRASRTWLTDQTQVIGVTVAGKHRAYALVGFTGRTQLLNDLIGDVPVTVAYSLKPERQRAFTSDQRGSPLDVWVVNAGREDHLVYRIGDVECSLELGDPPPPLKDLAVTRSTWKDWKLAHPDTDVCLRPAPVGSRH